MIKLSSGILFSFTLKNSHKTVKNICKKLIVKDILKKKTQIEQR